MPNESKLWNWTELPRFAKFCRDICAECDVDYEGTMDEERWMIEENICRNPFGATHPDPRFDGAEEWRYFRTAWAPGRTGALPPLVITFRIERFPSFGMEGVIQGREAWTEDAILAVGVSLLPGVV